MAIFAFGAQYGRKCMVQSFFANKVVGTGWNDEDDIAGHTMIKSMKTGDIVYLKRASPGSAITVLGIGIIIDNNFRSEKDLIELGRNVLWLSTDQFTIDCPVEKLNVRYNTVFEEFNPDVQLKIIEKLGE